MSRKNRRSKQRSVESNEDTVLANLAANDDNSTPMDSLRVLQEVFADRLDPEVVHDVFQTNAGNADQTLNNLFELCSSCPPRAPAEESVPSQAFAPSDHTITEVSHLVSELSLQKSTNSIAEYLTNSTKTPDPNVQVLNQLPTKSGHKSPLNAVMPFANLFSPKTNNNFVKTSHSLKKEIKEIIDKCHQKVLVLMRGLPGSGKTSLANYLVYGSDGLILSTDDYFIRKGVYQFRPTDLPDAHQWNQTRAKKYIESGRTPIVIDNTNLESWEMKPYVSFGYNNGYEIYFLEPDTPWARNPKELSKRNIHGIPKEKLELMSLRFERVTVKDLLNGLPLNKQLIQKSISETKVSTNACKQLILRSRSSPTNDEKSNEVFDEKSESAQTQDMTSSTQTVDNSSPNTEPTSPVADSQIDMDLLLALHQKNTDSEDCSSVYASDGGSSCVSQESGWERDDEFTYAQTNSKEKSIYCSNDLNNENDFNSQSDPKPQTEHKVMIESKTEACIQEECLDDIVVDETWDELNVDLLKADLIENNTQESNYLANNPNRRMFGLVGVPKHNWEFPPFPTVENSSTSNASQVCVTYYSRQTQTERKDWALLELKQSNEDSNEGLETESISREEDIFETKVEPKTSDCKVRLHKGTFTIDMPEDMTRDQKLNTLRQKFPKAENNHLNEILDACLEDEVWAEKLLSELNDDHFDVGSLEQLEPIVSSSESESNSNSTEDEECHELLVDQKSSEENEFKLILDPFLAAQLQANFGALTDSLSPEDLTITLSHGVARLLHHNWKKSLNGRPLKQNSSQSQVVNINNNKRKESKQKPKSLPVCQPLCPKSELEEIMDLEMAKELSRKEYTDSLAADAINALCPTKRQNAKELLSTKLKRDQLYQRYPGVDTTFLESIFESNYCSLGQTIDVLDNSLGLSDDFSRETKALIAQEECGPALIRSRSASPPKMVRKTVDINAVVQQMNGLLERKKEFHSKARLAFGRKMFAVASYYGDEAIQMQFTIDRLSRDIVNSLLTNCTNSNELDLHGLHVQEVNTLLPEYLKQKSDELNRSVGKRKLFVDIITGYGATTGVAGRLKPLVIQYLKQNNLTYEMVNMGVIRVVLTQS